MNERPSAVGVDTGGTFTDFAAWVNGRLVTHKELSTPGAPERAVIAGLAQLGARRGTPVHHGSTVATNTLLERKGARVAFVTNAGFEDLLEIGRQDRPDIYALDPHRVPPLVPRERRLGVKERRGPDGGTLEPLTPRAIADVVKRLRDLRPEAIAIGLLHAYADPASERRLARAIRALGVPVTTSSDLCREIREYERFATTVVNAYLLPRVARYLERLADACGPGLQVVLSHGGRVPVREAAREPVRQLLSGPAAGLDAAHHVRLLGGFRGPALTLDVGGTSTDVAYDFGPQIPRRRAREIGGFPIQLPLLDVHTVGAGGGSIADVDSGGLLTVGPASAGADPGPACYGRGGPATVTDAMVVLGRLPASAIGGGAITLDADRARAALARVGRALGVARPERAAEAVMAVANARMEAALRNVSTERGHDPRGAALIAFGGAGGLHACELAESLGVSAVIFPEHAGVLSAVGALTGSERYERSRTVLLPAGEQQAIEQVADALLREVDALFETAGTRIAYRALLTRYVGQSHEIEIPFGDDIERRFHTAHRARYGFAREGAAVEVVTVDVSGTMVTSGPSAKRGRTRGAAARSSGLARVHVRGGTRTAPIWSFESLPRVVKGPSIVIQSGATLWVAPGWSGGVDRAGALLLRRSGR
jgi:N-methylhydantoinase A